MTEPAFQRRLRQIARERVRRIRELLAEPTPARIEEALREAHTLKGEARVTGRADVATLAHELEEAIERDPAAGEAHLAALERAVQERTEPSRAAGDVDLEQTLLRVELSQVSELARASAELRSVQRDLDALTSDLAAHVAAPPADPAEDRRRLRSLSRRAGELAFALDQRTDVLERDLSELRTLPVQRLFDPLAHAARELGVSLDKPLEVTVDGGDAAVDRQVLDRMSEPLLHLVRNAVDHGIEAIDERAAAGKPVLGAIRLSARTRGREVRLTIADDGRGVDADQVRDALVARGVWTRAEADEAPRERVLSMLFSAGFTTRRTASEVSGRGLGLDIVQRRAESLGGGVEVASEPGRGTRVTVTVPASVVVDPVVPVEVDGSVYAFTTREVTSNREPSTLERREVGRAPAIRIDERTLPLHDLGAVLGGARRGPRGAVLILRAGGEEVALEVDRLLPVTAALRQAVDPFLDGVMVLRATVTLPGGMVALLDGREVVRRASRAAPQATPPALEPARAPARVLVVDDSELTRDVLVVSLGALGYEVTEAVDGARALDALAEGGFDLVLTDIDMPVMDGLELLSRIRARPETARLPVVVLTTRAEPRFLERASELGADAYLTKTAFHTDELARVVRRHVEPGDA